MTTLSNRVDQLHPLNVVSLFAGIGGFDLGFERAGMRTMAVVEWDGAATKVLKHRFPDAAHFSDVRTVHGHAVRDAIGNQPIDILAGGWPCTDVSVAGRRAGVAGERSGLYSEFVRLVDELDPTWVVAENVPGLLSSCDAENPHARPGDDFGLVLGDFTGFRPDTPADGWRNTGVCAGPRGTLVWRVLDAQHFGVAQRRRRVFLVLHRGDRLGPVAVLAEPEGLRWHPEARTPTWQNTARGTATRSSDGRNTGTHPDRGGILRGSQPTSDDESVYTPAVAATLTAGSSSPGISAPGRRQEDDHNLVAQPKTWRKSRRAQTNTDDETWVADQHTNTLNCFDIGDTRAVDLVTAPTAAVPLLEISKRTGVSTTDPRAGIGIGVEGDPMFTLQAAAQHGIGHPSPNVGADNTTDDPTWTVRRLTPEECEQLQGFPPGWTAIPDGASDSARYKQLGNAVCANVAEWIGTRLSNWHHGLHNYADQQKE